MNDVAIEVKNVSKNFLLPHEKTSSIKSTIVNVLKKKDKGAEIQHTLDDVSFEIKKGEFFGILGRNGSGKSTLLKLLAEIYRPTHGEINVNGKLVPFIELGVGFNPELTGKENVYLNGALLGFSKKQIDDRYEDIVSFAELEKFMDQKLKNYSSGMQVRLAFSVATHAEADILLVDEVLAVGDADFQRKCFQFFRALKKANKTVVFVSHDMAAVREYCDKAILIADGKISATGSASKIADEYLKLFNKSEADEATDTSGGDRWGTGDVIVDKLTLKVLKDVVKVEMHLRAANKDIDNVDVGIDIIDSSDHMVGGVHYIRKNPKGLNFRKGENKKILFEFDNVFGNQTYSLTVGVHTNNVTTITDFWRNAVTFTNTYEDDRYYPTILAATIREEK